MRRTSAVRKPRFPSPDSRPRGTTPACPLYNRQDEARGRNDWSIKTDELRVEGTFPTLDVVGNVALVSGSDELTRVQLEAAITSATDPIEKQLSSLAGEMDVLQKQITNRTNERDMLVQQVANLETAQAEQPASSGTNWWVAALAGAATALAMITAGGVIAIRRGLIQSPRLAHASA